MTRQWLFKLSPFGPHLCLVEITGKATNLEQILSGIGLGGSEYEPSALDSLVRKGE